MGMFLSQLPPAELARLKAELAETLIANFCYPRFFDHRTNSLRMRPVGRTKRQEVWLYLSSYDFTSWNRVDLMSSEFQRYIERLIIPFVQRNRSYFGQQGRKRMSDVRMLISSCALLVAEGMRGHLVGRQPGKPLFGSPRPSISWSTTKGSGYSELNWEQIVSGTMMLQQQLQEVRGEIKTSSIPASDVSSTPRYTKSARNGEHGVNGSEHEVAPLASEQVSNGKSIHQAGGQVLPNPAGANGSKSSPLPRISVAASASPIAAPPKPRTDGDVHLVETPTMPTPIVETPIAGRSAEVVLSPSSVSQPAQPAAIPATPSTQPWGFVRSPQSQQPLPMPPQTPAPPPTPVTGVATSFTRNAAPAFNEDVALFERMHLQLVLWLRIEAVRLGLDISGQTSLQLLELLRQQSGFDETRLQIVSTLLNLSNQVMKTGHAGPLDYKQGLMFYLMHTQH